MSFRPQPGDHFYKIVLRHGGAASGRSIHAAPDVKKDGATRSRHRRIGIVPDLDQPVIGKISRAHFFVSVIVRRIFRINHDVAIIIGRPRIIAPNVCIGDLMIRIVAAGRQVRVVSKNLSDLENSRGCPAVSFFFVKAWLALTEIPVPHARPFLPNNTGNGPPTIFQSPPRGRSTNRNSPRIEFHVGAIPSISCVQSSGMPSAKALMPRSTNKQITNLHKGGPDRSVMIDIVCKSKPL